MLRVVNTEQFKKAIDQIALFIDECNIHINEDGFTVKAFDNAQMLYVEYNLDSKGLEGELESNVFGVNIVELNKILSKISSSDKLKFSFNQYELDLIVEGDYNRTYTFPLKELDEKELNVNSSDYPIIMKENATILRDIFSSTKLVADSVLFDCKDSKVTLFADGINGKYKTDIAVESESNFQTKFSSAHLYNMLRNVDAQTKVTIKINPQQPLFVSYSLGNNHIKYYLAHMFV